MANKIKITKREQPSPDKKKPKSKTRWSLLIIIALPIFAIWLITNQSSLDFNASNRGRWLKAPLSIKNITLKSEEGRNIDFDRYRGRWMLMYLNDSECTVSCLDSMNKIQQVRMDLGKDRTRVSALIVTPTLKQNNPVYDILRDEFITLRYATITDDSLQKLVQELPYGSKPTNTGRIYLIDPKSNIIISYSTIIKTERVVKDITKLLKA